MFIEDRGQLSPAQVAQLLKPIKPSRVLQAQGHSHVSQQDITAHLIRMFGFGGFDIEVLNCDLIFESERFDANGTGLGRYDVAYRGMVRLTIRNEEGATVAAYENGSVGDAKNQQRAEGHDLAYKSAISLSIKRAAIALGDQFGLSLYNKGQLDALVRATLVGTEEVVSDVQEGVAQQVSLGNDEVDKSDDVAPVANSVVPAGFIEKLQASTTEAELTELWAVATESGFSAEVRPAFTAHKDFIRSVQTEEAK